MIATFPEKAQSALTDASLNENDTEFWLQLRTLILGSHCGASELQGSPAPSQVSAEPEG